MKYPWKKQIKEGVLAHGSKRRQVHHGGDDIRNRKLTGPIFIYTLEAAGGGGWGEV